MAITKDSADYSVKMVDGNNSELFTSANPGMVYQSNSSGSEVFTTTNPGIVRIGDSGGDEVFTTTNPGIVQIGNSGGDEVFTAANPAIVQIGDSGGTEVFTTTNPGITQVGNSGGDEIFTSTIPGYVDPRSTNAVSSVHLRNSFLAGATTASTFQSVVNVGAATYDVMGLYVTSHTAAAGSWLRLAWMANLTNTTYTGKFEVSKGKDVLLPASGFSNVPWFTTDVASTIWVQASTTFTIGGILLYK